MRKTMLNSIEIVISALVVGSLAWAFFPSGVIPKEYNIIYQFVEQYRVVGDLLVLLAIFSAIRLLSVITLRKRRLVIRESTNFALAVGYLFFGVLSVAAFGPFQVNWLNAFAIAAISGILYLNSRLDRIHGRE